MSNGKNISMKELAKICDVSVATVSRVINQNGRYSQETQNKVLEAIEKYEFTPNMVARSLKKNETKSIGIIVPDITNEFFSSLVLEIETQLFSSGYSVFICNTNRDSHKEIEYLKILNAKGVDGLIYISGGEKELQTPVTRNIPIVCIDRRPHLDTSTAIVESDNYYGGLLATQTLIDKGCKKILLIKSKRKYSSSRFRYEGYLEALSKNNIAFDKNLYIEVDKSNFEYSKKAILEKLAKGLCFDGVFCTNDWLAIGAVAALREKGVQVPKDVKIIGFDDVPASRYTYPAISTIHQDREQLGLEAADAVLDLIANRNKKKKVHIVVPVKLILRETT